MDVSQNICLICKACPNMYFEEKKFVSIYDSFDFIKIKDMLEDFNYKVELLLIFYIICNIYCLYFSIHWMIH